MKNPSRQAIPFSQFKYWFSSSSVTKLERPHDYFACLLDTAREMNVPSLDAMEQFVSEVVHDRSDLTQDFCPIGQTRYIHIDSPDLVAKVTRDEASCEILFFASNEGFDAIVYGASSATFALNLSFDEDHLWQDFCDVLVSKDPVAQKLTRLMVWPGSRVLAKNEIAKGTMNAWKRVWQTQFSNIEDLEQDAKFRYLSTMILSKEVVKLDPKTHHAFLEYVKDFCENLNAISDQQQPLLDVLTQYSASYHPNHKITDLTEAFHKGDEKAWHEPSLDQALDPEDKSLEGYDDSRCPLSVLDQLVALSERPKLDALIGLGKSLKFSRSNKAQGIVAAVNHLDGQSDSEALFIGGLSYTPYEMLVIHSVYTLLLFKCIEDSPSFKIEIEDKNAFRAFLRALMRGTYLSSVFNLDEVINQHYEGGNAIKDSRVLSLFHWLICHKDDYTIEENDQVSEKQSDQNALQEFYAKKMCDVHHKNWHTFQEKGPKERGSAFMLRGTSEADASRHYNTASEAIFFQNFYQFISGCFGQQKSHVAIRLKQCFSPLFDYKKKMNPYQHFNFIEHKEDPNDPQARAFMVMDLKNINPIVCKVSSFGRKGPGARVLPSRPLSDPLKGLEKDVRDRHMVLSEYSLSSNGDLLTNPRAQMSVFQGILSLLGTSGVCKDERLPQSVFTKVLDLFMTPKFLWGVHQKTGVTQTLIHAIQKVFDQTSDVINDGSCNKVQAAQTVLAVMLGTYYLEYLDVVEHNDADAGALAQILKEFSDCLKGKEKKIDVLSPVMGATLREILLLAVCQRDDATEPKGPLLAQIMQALVLSCSYASKEEVGYFKPLVEFRQIRYDAFLSFCHKNPRILDSVVDHCKGLTFDRDGQPHTITRGKKISDGLYQFNLEGGAFFTLDLQSRELGGCFGILDISPGEYPFLSEIFHPHLSITKLEKRGAWLEGVVSSGDLEKSFKLFLSNASRDPVLVEGKPEVFIETKQDEWCLATFDAHKIKTDRMILNAKTLEVTEFVNSEGHWQVSMDDDIWIRVDQHDEMFGHPSQLFVSQSTQEKPLLEQRRLLRVPPYDVTFIKAPGMSSFHATAFEGFALCALPVKEDLRAHIPDHRFTLMLKNAQDQCMMLMPLDRMLHLSDEERFESVQFVDVQEQAVLKRPSEDESKKFQVAYFDVVQSDEGVDVLKPRSFLSGLSLFYRYALSMRIHKRPDLIVRMTSLVEDLSQLTPRREDLEAIQALMRHIQKYVWTRTSLQVQIPDMINEFDISQALKDRIISQFKSIDSETIQKLAMKNMSDKGADNPIEMFKEMSSDVLDSETHHEVQAAFSNMDVQAIENKIKKRMMGEEHVDLAFAKVLVTLHEVLKRTPSLSTLGDMPEKFYATLNQALNNTTGYQGKPSMAYASNHGIDFASKSFDLLGQRSCFDAIISFIDQPFFEDASYVVSQEMVARAEQALADKHLSIRTTLESAIRHMKTHYETLKQEAAESRAPISWIKDQQTGFQRALTEALLYSSSSFQDYFQRIDRLGARLQDYSSESDVHPLEEVMKALTVEGIKQSVKGFLREDWLAPQDKCPYDYQNEMKKKTILYDVLRLQRYFTFEMVQVESKDDNAPYRMSAPRAIITPPIQACNDPFDMSALRQAIGLWEDEGHGMRIDDLQGLGDIVAKGVDEETDIPEVFAAQMNSAERIQADRKREIETFKASYKNHAKNLMEVLAKVHKKNKEDIDRLKQAMLTSIHTPFSSLEHMPYELKERANKLWHAHAIRAFSKFRTNDEKIEAWIKDMLSPLGMTQFPPIQFATLMGVDGSDDEIAIGIEEHVQHFLKENKQVVVDYLLSISYQHQLDRIYEVTEEIERDPNHDQSFSTLMMLLQQERPYETCTPEGQTSVPDQILRFIAFEADRGVILYPQQCGPYAKVKGALEESVILTSQPCGGGKTFAMLCRNALLFLPLPIQASIEDEWKVSAHKEGRPLYFIKPDVLDYRQGQAHFAKKLSEVKRQIERVCFGLSEPTRVRPIKPVGTLVIDTSTYAFLKQQTLKQGAAVGICRDILDLLNRIDQVICDEFHQHGGNPLHADISSEASPIGERYAEYASDFAELIYAASEKEVHFLRAILDEDTVDREKRLNDLKDTDIFAHIFSELSVKAQENHQHINKDDLASIWLEVSHSLKWAEEQGFDSESDLDKCIINRLTLYTKMLSHFDAVKQSTYDVSDVIAQDTRISVPASDENSRFKDNEYAMMLSALRYLQNYGAVVQEDMVPILRYLARKNTCTRHHKRVRSYILEALKEKPNAQEKLKNLWDQNATNDEDMHHYQSISAFVFDALLPKNNQGRLAQTRKMLMREHLMINVFKHFSVSSKTMKVTAAQYVEDVRKNRYWCEFQSATLSQVQQTLPQGRGQYRSNPITSTGVVFNELWKKKDDLNFMDGFNQEGQWDWEGIIDTFLEGQHTSFIDATGACSEYKTSPLVLIERMRQRLKAEPKHSQWLIEKEIRWAIAMQKSDDGLDMVAVNLFTGEQKRLNGVKLPDIRKALGSTITPDQIIRVFGYKATVGVDMKPGKGGAMVLHGLKDCDSAQLVQACMRLRGLGLGREYIQTFVNAAPNRSCRNVVELLQGLADMDQQRLDGLRLNLAIDLLRTSFNDERKRYVQPDAEQDEFAQLRAEWGDLRQDRVVEKILQSVLQKADDNKSWMDMRSRILDVCQQVGLKITDTIARQTLMTTEAAPEQVRVTLTQKEVQQQSQEVKPGPSYHFDTMPFLKHGVSLFSQQMHHYQNIMASLPSPLLYIGQDQNNAPVEMFIGSDEISRRTFSVDQPYALYNVAMGVWEIEGSVPRLKRRLDAFVQKMNIQCRSLKQENFMPLYKAEKMNLEPMYRALRSCQNGVEATLMLGWKTLFEDALKAKEAWKKKTSPSLFFAGLLMAIGLSFVALSFTPWMSMTSIMPLMAWISGGVVALTGVAMFIMVLVKRRQKEDTTSFIKEKLKDLRASDFVQSIVNGTKTSMKMSLSELKRVLPTKLKHLRSKQKRSLNRMTWIFGASAIFFLTMVVVLWTPIPAMLSISTLALHIMMGVVLAGFVVSSMMVPLLWFVAQENEKSKLLISQGIKNQFNRSKDLDDRINRNDHVYSMNELMEDCKSLLIQYKLLNPNDKLNLLSLTSQIEVLIEKVSLTELETMRANLEVLPKHELPPFPGVEAMFKRIKDRMDQRITALRAKPGAVDYRHMNESELGEVCERWWRGYNLDPSKFSGLADMISWLSAAQRNDLASKTQKMLDQAPHLSLDFKEGLKRMLVEINSASENSHTMSGGADPVRTRHETVDYCQMSEMDILNRLIAVINAYGADTNESMDKIAAQLTADQRGDILDTIEEVFAQATQLGDEMVEVLRDMRQEMISANENGSLGGPVRSTQLSPKPAVDPVYARLQTLSEKDLWEELINEHNIDLNEMKDVQTDDGIKKINVGVYYLFNALGSKNIGLILTAMIGRSPSKTVSGKIDFQGDDDWFRTHVFLDRVKSDPGFYKLRIEMLKNIDVLEEEKLYDFMYDLKEFVPSACAYLEALGVKDSESQPSP